MPTPDPRVKVSFSRDIAALTSALTLEEKAALTVGIDNWRTASFPRLGIPSVKMTDGPNGARGDTRAHESITPSVCIPRQPRSGRHGTRRSSSGRARSSPGKLSRRAAGSSSRQL